MKYKTLNLNPFHKLTSDCAVRAVAKAENLSWSEVYETLFDISREIGEVFNAKSVVETFLDDRYESFEVAYKAKDFLKYSFKDGTYLVLMTCGHEYHLVCVIDGVYYDTKPLPKGCIVETYYKKI